MKTQVSRILGISSDPKKLKWYLIMLLSTGVLLLLLSGPYFSKLADSGGEADESGTVSSAGGTENGTPEVNMSGGLDTKSYERALEQRLEEILSLVDGVGRVKVVITLSGSGETLYAVDSNITTSSTQEQDAQGGSRTQTSSSSQDKTLVITDRAGVDHPLVIKETMPAIAGVVIVAEGGGDIFIKDALMRAASTLLDIELNRVQVLKMASGE